MPAIFEIPYYVVIIELSNYYALVRKNICKRASSNGMSTNMFSHNVRRHCRLPTKVQKIWIRDLLCFAKLFYLNSRAILVIDQPTYFISGELACLMTALLWPKPIYGSVLASVDMELMESHPERIFMYVLTTLDTTSDYANVQKCEKWISSFETIYHI